MHVLAPDPCFKAPAYAKVDSLTCFTCSIFLRLSYTDGLHVVVFYDAANLLDIANMPVISTPPPSTLSPNWWYLGVGETLALF